MTTGKELCTQSVTPIYVERGFEMSDPHGTNFPLNVRSASIPRAAGIIAAFLQV
jgi:hypothetical protein